MKQFLTWGGLGFGLALGGGMVYAFYLSEAMRLAAVGIGAFMLAALTIGGTALAVNRQWTNTLGTQQAPHIIHNHRYPVFQNNQPPESGGSWSPTNLRPLLPDWPGQNDTNNNFEDEVVA